VFTVVVNALRAIEFNTRRMRHEDPNDASVDPTFKDLYREWELLDNDSKALLDKVDVPNYSLPLEAHGVVETRDLVSSTSSLSGTYPHALQLRDLNTLGRLCRLMGIPFSFLRVDWPIVSVEFRWLKGVTESWEVRPGVCG
jgi:hypothetical protein